VCDLPMKLEKLYDRLLALTVFLLYTRTLGDCYTHTTTY
jgi:hypothetical protein